MNREIEFRAWLKESLLEKNGYYKYESYKEKIDKLGRMRKVHSMHLNKKKVIITSAWGGNISMSFDDIELMQWTGKKDKNGTKIFEHDLIQLDGTSYIYEIVWDNESSSYKMQNKNDTFEWDVLELRTFKTPYITVLSNIYENKELLENE